MNNWKEEFEKKFGVIYHKEPEGFGIQINDHIESFIKKVEQDAYKRGLHSAMVINESDIVKLTYDELMDMDRAEKEGIKEGLEMARSLRPVTVGCIFEAEDPIINWDKSIQQELNKL